MKNKKGFKRKEALIISLHQMGEKFEELFYKIEDRHRGYNKYWSEFNPLDNEDYGHTFTQENLENYWKDQTENNDFNGTLESFIKEYCLEMDVWFINCGYDFTGVKEIIIDF